MAGATPLPKYGEQELEEKDLLTEESETFSLIVWNDEVNTFQ